MTGAGAGLVLKGLHPGLIMMLGGLIVAFLPDKFKKYQDKIALIVPVLSFISFFTLNAKSAITYGITDSLVLKLIHFDNLAYAFMLILCIIAVITAIYGQGIQKQLECGMSMFYTGSIMGIILAGDVISLIVFWEIAAFASMYVIYSSHNREAARSSFRYILVHSFGGNMMLVGLLMYMFKYGAAIANISSHTHEGFFWFILIGAAVNAAIPPLNSWMSDSYPESTLTGTVYLASCTSKAAIFILIRFFAGMQALVWIGVIMAVFAALMAIMENDLRRLLSYHIVSQLGMMVASVGIEGAMGANGATAHVITNILFKGVLLMGAGAVIYATGKKKITELGGLGRRMPVTSICFLISSLAIAGLPGLSGFVSKAVIMDAMHEAGFTVPALLMTIAGVGTLLSITLKINYYVFWGPCDERTAIMPLKEVPKTMEWAMIAGTALTVFIGLFPQAFYFILPYDCPVHPYHLAHIMEYVFIFIGGGIPFFMYIKNMRPHEEITIDFDWFYRRPLFKAVNAISVWLNEQFAWFHDLVIGGVRNAADRMNDPYIITKNSTNVVIRNFSFENKDKRIGDVITVIELMLMIMLIVGVIIM